MKNNMKIRLSVLICLLMISQLSIAAIYSGNPSEPKNEKVLQVLLEGETDIPKDELENRTFRVGDKVSFCIVKGTRQFGEIVGFSDDEVFIKQKDGLTMNYKVSLFSSIQKETRNTKISRITKFNLLGSSIIGIIGTKIQIDKASKRANRHHEGDIFGFFQLFDSMIYMAVLLIGFFVWTISAIFALIFTNRLKKENALRWKVRKGARLEIVDEV